MPEFQTVCITDEIAKGESKSFLVHSTSIAVFNVDGKFYALRDACPHAGASLAQGTLEDDVVRCRIHHWGFCVRDGSYVDEDKPQYNARQVMLRVTEGEVQVAITNDNS